MAHNPATCISFLTALLVCDASERCESIPYSLTSTSIFLLFAADHFEKRADGFGEIPHSISDLLILAKSEHCDRRVEAGSSRSDNRGNV